MDSYIRGLWFKYPAKWFIQMGAGLTWLDNQGQTVSQYNINQF